MNVKILADSASDLSQKWYEKLNVEVVPVHVFIEGKKYLDGVTISPTEMYAEMRKGKRVTTSQPNPQAFQEPDRKSTRLNSSHVASSYAVFCLKKKKKLYSTLTVTIPARTAD